MGSVGEKRSGFLLVASSAVFLALAACGIGAGTAPALAAEPCPNEERRAEQGALGLALLDCRAYELVSPGGLLLQDSDPERESEAGSRASISGNAITYFTSLPSTDADSSGYFYLSRRGPDGWRSRNVAPQNTAGGVLADACGQNLYFSADLSQNIDEEGWFEDGLSLCRRNQDVLAPGEPELYRNVFLHDVASDTYQLINTTPEGIVPANAKFQDASEDFSRILFTVEAKLASGSPSGYNLFVWSQGAVRLLTYLPNGTPVAGELAEGAGYRLKSGTSVSGSGLAPVRGAFSEDGSRAFFYANGNLYLRQNPDQPQSAIEGGQCSEADKACTTQIDVSQGPGASGAGNFWYASSDGSRVFFTSERKLTADSTAVSGRADLYEYDVESGALTDLTAGGPGATDVRGVSAAAQDGSYVYFVANGVLAPGASPGSCRGIEAPTQTCNLYVARDGAVEFIAALSRSDDDTWQEASTSTTAVNSIPRLKQSRVRANISPSGRYLAFASVRSLTGYDNRDIKTGGFNRQLFLYDAEANEGAGELSCVSCIPDGTRPDESVEDFELSDNYGPGTSGGKARWKKTAVLDDGRVFLDTIDGLVSEDANGRRDVYQYLAGEHRLISAGNHVSDARFFDATPSGSDVFFRTPQTLVGSDTDKENVSLYDARVGGGFPEPLPPAPPCEGEGCRDAVAAPASTLLPATSTFQGPGNQKARSRAKNRRRCGRVNSRHKRPRCNRAKRARKRASRKTSNSKGRAGR